MDEVRVARELMRSDSRKGVAACAAALLLFLVALQGCRTVSSAPRALESAEPSPEALASRFLDGLQADDLEALKRLRITKDEFCTYVFPELPASKLNNVTCDFVWSQATLKSMSGMTRMLDQNKSKRYELVSVRFSATERHQTYNVLKDPVVTVRDETGAVQSLRLFGSMLEMDGQYKLFSFVVD